MRPFADRNLVTTNGARDVGVLVHHNCVGGHKIAVNGAENFDTFCVHDAHNVGIFCNDERMLRLYVAVEKRVNGGIMVKGDVAMPLALCG